MALLASVSGIAWAQTSQYFVPVEEAFLHSRAELQVDYSRYEVGRETIEMVVLSLEGQYALADRVELGANVPMLLREWSSMPCVEPTTEFGDLRLDVKARLWGTPGLAVSAFASATLPTHSDQTSRESSVITGGAGAALRRGATLVGANAQVQHTAHGGGGQDFSFVGVDAYVAHTFRERLALKLAVQYYNSVYPSSMINAVGLAPALVALLHPRLHVSLGARIAPTDESKFFFNGRSSFLGTVGYTF